MTPFNGDIGIKVLVMLLFFVDAYFSSSEPFFDPCFFFFQVATSGDGNGMNGKNSGHEQQFISLESLTSVS